MTQRTGLATRVVGALLLATSGAVHLARAHVYDANVVSDGTWSNSHLSEALLFRVQGVACVVVAVGLLVAADRRLTRVWFATAWLAGVSLAAVLVYRYAGVGAIGPLPDLSEATWSPLVKPVSAVAEALAFLLATTMVRRAPR